MSEENKTTQSKHAARLLIDVDTHDMPFTSSAQKTRIHGNLAIRVGDKTDCVGHVTKGAPGCRIEWKHAARVGDPLDCPAKVKTGSTKVKIGDFGGPGGLTIGSGGQETNDKSTSSGDTDSAPPMQADNPTPPVTEPDPVTDTADASPNENSRFTPAYVQQRMQELAQQGHGPQRHGPQLTDQQLDDRVQFKIDPETGTRTDKYRPTRNHSCGNNATKITSEISYVIAEDYLRDTDEFKSKLLLNPDSIKITRSLEEIFGINYKNEVYGRGRTAPWPNNSLPTVETDFTNGKMIAIYVLQSNGKYDLLTMYPEPS